ncbi:lipocalin family protein [Flagellimonas amoyensis]|uniref:lipocalin family protein n=1 Tax=Flagellimonas amoyensis TaxID=2169401 RepID=UPI000D3A3A4F|nr:lipocalin family protein [Allomuricauda amoyensis]
MKNKGLVLLFLGIAFMAATQGAEAQFLKRLGKKTTKAAERGVENTVERKAEQKAEEGTDKVIETVFGVPKKVVDKNGDTPSTKSLEGTWYYESLEGVPGFESLNECGKKSSITYSGTNYHVLFYDNDCNLLTDSGGIFELEGDIMTITAIAEDEMGTTKMRTTQTILEHGQDHLIIKDDLTGAVVNLTKSEE